jgi:hypothetical protein
MASGNIKWLISSCIGVARKALSGANQLALSLSAYRGGIGVSSVCLSVRGGINQYRSIWHQLAYGSQRNGLSAKKHRKAYQTAAAA